MLCFLIKRSIICNKLYIHTHHRSYIYIFLSTTHLIGNKKEMVGGICEYPPCALTLDAGPLPDSLLNTQNAHSYMLSRSKP